MAGMSNVSSDGSDASTIKDVEHDNGHSLGSPNNPLTMVGSKLNKEALDALEKSLLQEEENLRQKKFQEEEKHIRLIAFHDSCMDDVSKQLEEHRLRQHSLEEEIRREILATDEVMEDIRSVETAYSDVARKYEKTKRSLEQKKEEEGALFSKQCQLNSARTKDTKAFEGFTQGAEQNLNDAYQEFATKMQSHENTSASLIRQLRLSEMRGESLNNELNRKQKERIQLDTMADELIGKQAAGGH